MLSVVPMMKILKAVSISVAQTGLDGRVIASKT
jgi:hypothetical protein